jgi:hypothetical protein
LTESGRGLMPPTPHTCLLPAVAVSVPDHGSLAPPGPTCPVCSRPLSAGAYSSLNQGDMAHPEWPTSPPSVNRWPEGIRNLLCLNCSRIFPSESKMQRLCKACR